MKPILLAVALSALTLTACSQTRYCTGEQNYQKARSLPPLQATQGLTIPDSQGALSVPEGRGTSGGFAETYVNAEGESEQRCLDMPPRLVGADPIATPMAPPPPEGG
ncbi:MAG: hypothetical protein VX836_19880 [Pseudomonadota bacterium]|jgi:hypothetical protein|nr:hypothetical protein [Pseudomonadota bacterium]